MGPLGNDRDGQGKKLIVHKTVHQIYPSAEVTFWCALTRHISVFTSFIHLERSCHKPLQMSFSPSFQSCTFQVPDHPSSSLAIDHKSVYNQTSAHFSFQTKYMTLCTAQSFAFYEDFPLLVSFRVVPESSCNSAAAHFFFFPFVCFLFCETGFSSSYGASPGTCSVDQAGLELIEICLPPKCWD